MIRGCSDSVSFHFCRLQITPHLTTSRQGDVIDYTLISGKLRIKCSCRVLLILLLLVLFSHMIICLNSLVVTADCQCAASMATCKWLALVEACMKASTYLPSAQLP
ncbi:unnamed protein product [Taenia asiatica]|uniref:Secreted protein n=1 Tax=Taenia asiatica TaxID=60517 RepID=A0A0R3W0H8_TAEAS|nr:unnamed protein product [Taenia asiatica]